VVVVVVLVVVVVDLVILVVVFYVHVTVYRNKFLFNKTNKRTNFPNLFLSRNTYLFRAVPLPIIRSFSLYIRHWYMSCRFDDSFQARPGCSILVRLLVL